MADADMEVYDNTHRALLQHLLSVPMLDFPSAQHILSAIHSAHDPARPTLPADIHRPDFDAYIFTLNTALSAFDLEIRQTRHQVSKEEIWALVNVKEDGVAQMATSFSADELAFIKRVLDAMFETYNTRRAEVIAITSMQATKLAKPPGVVENRRDSGAKTQTQAASTTGLTIMQAEKVLKSLVAEGWFECSQREFYSLTPRALMELRGWLIDTYNDQEAESASDSGDDGWPHEKIKFCQACREIITIGQRCPDLSCKARLHGYCVRNMFRAQGGQEKCPVCSAGWVEVPSVGEGAARKQRASQGNAAASKRRTWGSSSRVSLDGACDESDGNAEADVVE